MCHFFPQANSYIKDYWLSYHYIDHFYMILCNVNVKTEYEG